MIYPQRPVRYEERERVEMQVIQDGLERRCQAHEEARLNVERVTRNDIDWLTDGNQVVGVKRRFVSVREIER